MDGIAPRFESLPDNGEFAVERFQVEIHLRDLRNDRQSQRPLRLYRLQVGRYGRLVLPAQVPPNIDFPPESQVRVQFRVVFFVIASVIEVFAVAVEVHSGPGKHLRKSDPLGRHQFADTRRCGKHVLVVVERLRDQSLQDRIGIKRTPADVGSRSFSHTLFVERSGHLFQFRCPERTPHPAGKEAQCYSDHQ